MTVLALLGAAVGCGVLLLVAGLVGSRPTLEAELARLDPFGDRAGAGAGGSARGGALARLGQPLADLADRTGGGRAKTDSDLAVVGQSRAVHAASVGTCALVGGAALPATAALAAVLGVHVGLTVPLIGCCAAAACGAFAPVASLRRQAVAARGRFRHALASWLELVALGQAAGMGLESALQAASSVCDDPSFARIRRAVDVSRSTGIPPWEALERLGGELGIPDLEELGSTLELAGAEGARIRASLSSKAGSLRRRELTEAEARANAMTERLFVPSVVLMFGFLVFVGYPALVTVMRVL